MKNLFTSINILSCIIILGSCNIATEKDYEEMTSDMCDCFKPLEENLSEGMQETIINAPEDEEGFKKEILKYSMNHPVVAMKDAKYMKDVKNGPVMECVNGLEKKYDHLYTSESKSEVQKKILDIMEKKNECALTYKFVKLGLAKN